jgi:aminoglycoside phosphotransferase (APT) family kinase protein
MEDVGLDTAAEANAYVLRRPNKFRDSDGFLDVRQEYRVLKRLRPTSVPAPEPVLLVEDCSALESPFLLTTYVGGTAIGLGSLPPERFRYPDARERLGRVVVETLADLHTVDVEPFADVCERKSVRVMVDETIDRMETAMDATGHRPPGFRDVASWLRDNAPAESTTAVCHGDYRPGNILFVGDDVPEVSGVVDWETAWLGDPRTELGYLLLR